MSLTSSEYGYAHLAVDVQDTSLCFLQPQHRKDLIEKETAFVKTLRELLVPTTWLAIDVTDYVQELGRLYGPGKVTFFDLAQKIIGAPTKIKIIPMITAWPNDQVEARNKEQLAKYGFVQTTPKQDEIIHTRSRGDNPFDNERDYKPGLSALAGILKQTFQAKQLIITGLNSSECVAGTIFGALIDGYDCNVVSDLVADRAESKGRLNRTWHEDAIIDKLMELVVESGLSDRHQLQFVQAIMTRVHFKTAEKLIGELEKRVAPARVPVVHKYDPGP